MTREHDQPANVPCPFCGHQKSDVCWTRYRDSDRVVTRRRQCKGQACGRRFNTTERVDPPEESSSLTPV